MYGAVGVVLDWIIALVRAMLDVGNGDVFWLFAPFLLVLGALIGFFDGKFASSDSMEAFTAEPDPKYDDLSIRHEFSGAWHRYFIRFDVAGDDDFDLIGSSIIITLASQFPLALS